ncbi:MAG: hypothetical protein H7326_11705 [Bdellovibrionaceae bacterium]|nr:hypothetical protein [Pseudobdellovibrionaceae bacterium]
MEKFLVFWSLNNAVIIEILVALILISTIFLVYRAFFGPKGVDTFDTSTAGPSLNTAHIEKTLQKILDQQSSKAASPAGASSHAGSAPAELVRELTSMRTALEEKEKQIVVLQDKAAAAVKAAAAPGASPSAEAIAQAAQAAAGMAEKERGDYEAKIRELEARLAEYEIISEDIADLSFFKEENQRLTKELEGLRNMAASVSKQANAVAPEAMLTNPVPVAQAPAPAVQAPVAAIPPAATVAEAAAVPDIKVDDSLLADFAQAVEGQKAADEAPKNNDENEKLLAEFENFNKKS